ncbi:MAG: repressor LexA, partial [Candidatus Rokuibacteriota bacterium]
RYLREGTRIVLKPENRTMKPIVVDPRQRHIRILGKVIGLLRGF